MQAIADGYDPTLGVMHNGRREKPAFILDLVERERPKVDATVLAFVAKHVFSGADFVIREWRMPTVPPTCEARFYCFGATILLTGFGG